MFLLAALVSTGASAQGVTWEEQAERLQKVNATLLDSVPIPDPLTASMAFSARAHVSFLPKVNPRVGAKNEKVPSAPVHTVPNVQWEKRLNPSLSYLVGGGLLPPGGERLFGINARLLQWTAHSALQLRLSAPEALTFVTLGAQYGHASLTGAITALEASDEFTADTLLLYVAPGLKWEFFWSTLLISYKQTTSSFSIPADETKLIFTDTLQDSSIPVVLQLSSGYHVTPSLSVGASYVFVSQRLLMPRAFVGYRYSL